MKKHITLFLVFVMMFSIVTSTTYVTASAKAKVQLSKTSITLIVGKTKKLTLKNAKRKVKWSSSKSSVAKVSSNGKVTAKKAGTAKIIAKCSGKKYTCKVKVYKKFKLLKSSLKLVVGKTKYLDYKGGYGDIKWKSSNKKIATVDYNGEIETVKVGSCTISATRNGVTKKCKLIVYPNFKNLFNMYCDSEWATVSSNGSYLYLDENPYDIEEGNDYYYSYTYVTEVCNAIKKFIKN